MCYRRSLYPYLASLVAIKAHARTSEGFYTAAMGALRKGCDVTRLFLGITERPSTASGLMSGDSRDDDIGATDAGEGCAGDTETFLFGVEGGDDGDGRQRQGHECAWKLLGDLYTYGHKLPPMCFVDGDGCDGRGERLLETGSAAAVAAQQVTWF